MICPTGGRYPPRGVYVAAYKRQFPGAQLCAASPDIDLSLTPYDQPGTIEPCSSKFLAKFPTSRLSPRVPAFARSRGCDEHMDVVAGANAKAPLASDYPMAQSVAELHRYEATGLGRKEFKIKHLI